VSFRSARVASVGLACAALAAGTLVPVDDALDVSRAELAADGRSSTRVRAVARALVGNETPFGRAPIAVSGEPLGVTVLVDHRGDVVVRAGVVPGVVVVRAGRARAELTLTHDLADRDRDGLPDVAELLDEGERRAFTAWFTGIAEMQFRAVDDDWPPVHQDCAGLVRYATKEALRAHDDAWRRARRSAVLTRAPDVRGAVYPHVPVVGDRIWRATAAPFDPSDADLTHFTASPNARTLFFANSAFVSRDVREAKAGDLLFFAVPDDTGSRMHTMIALGETPGASNDARAARVVYHTGGEGERGVVKLVTLDALVAHPDHAWRPLVDNPRFLGVHRLHLVTHERATPTHLSSMTSSMNSSLSSSLNARDPLVARVVEER